jgi:hypothetical protein
MSNRPTKSPQNSEEIDLGVLFNAISRGIANAISFFIKLLRSFIYALINFVIFVKKNAYVYIAASLIGLLTGIFLDDTMPKQYIATATLEPHFESSRQMYSNVAYLNDLALQKDSMQLAAFFEIKPSKAATITKLQITPFTTEVKQRKEYNNYFSKLDSIVASETSFEDYVSKLEVYDSQIHVLEAESTTQDIFPLLLSPLIQSVSAVEYFMKKQATELANLELLDSITIESIAQTDSLLSLLQRVRVVEANKEFSNGTNVYMSNDGEDNTEISLLDRKIALTEELEEIRTEKLEALNVVDVISSFPNYGYLDNSIFKNRKLLAIITAFLLVSLYYFFKKAEVIRERLIK